MLKNHIDKIVKKTKSKKSRGRGGIVTFLSKSTVSKILNLCCEAIRKAVISDVLEAGIYSIQLDSTQDVSVTDQLAIILRYVKTGVVHGHLYKVANVKGSATAENLHEALKLQLDQDNYKL